jgi:hypothetical protein
MAAGPEECRVSARNGSVPGRSGYAIRIRVRLTVTAGVA